MLAEVLDCLRPRPGAIIVDCTVGFAGHARELLQQTGPGGKLIGFDLDASNLEKARERLAEVELPFSLHHGNFAGAARVVGETAPEGCDCLLADLGMSSMQLDDPQRGFSFMRDGPLDMRMDPSRGRTAADLLATLPEAELAALIAGLGDEPQADRIARAIVRQRGQAPLLRTEELRQLIEEAAPVKVNPHPTKGQPKPHQQKLAPIARVFQALRILVNRELGNLEALLRQLPSLLKRGGRAAIISFHSGEDRLVKAAFKEGQRAGVYAAASDEPLRATFEERVTNPRARSAKLRWAVRG